MNFDNRSATFATAIGFVILLLLVFAPGAPAAVYIAGGALCFAGLLGILRPKTGTRSQVGEDDHDKQGSRG